MHGKGKMIRECYVLSLWKFGLVCAKGQILGPTSNLSWDLSIK